MNNLESKIKKFGIIAFIFMAAVLLLNCWLLLTPNLEENTYTIWNEALYNIGFSSNLRIVSIFLLGLFFTAIPLVGLSIFNVVKKKEGLLFVTCSFEAAFVLVILSYQLIFRTLSNIVFALAVINTILLITAATLLIFRHSYLNQIVDEEIEVDQTKASKTSSLVILIVNIVQLVLCFSLFFIPLYYTPTSEPHILVSVLNSGKINTTDTIFFMAFLAVFIINLLYFISTLSSYFSNKKTFVSKSKNFLFYSCTVTLGFFLSGLGISYYYTINNYFTYTIAYIPLLISGLICIIFAIYKGKFDYANNIDVVRQKYIPKYYKSEGLIYFTALTILTFISLFLKVIRVTSSLETFSQDIKLTGLELLQNYGTLGQGYQVLAFYVFLMLLVSGTCFVWVIASYFSKYKYYPKVLKIGCYLNVVLIFLLGISGFYFKIAQAINVDNLKSLFEYYGITFSETYKYNISSDVIYAFAGEAFILILAIVRKSLNNETYVKDQIDKDASEKEENNSNQESSAPELLEDVVSFDPCPAFSELDNNKAAFDEDFENRSKLLAKDISLNGLVTFIVDYAKNSRLHLSYTNESIATFLAGLGACRLTILQGMSGTGKTSLPKIFSEAINGNCDIIEVESSWKDKNELLGYYNEFSSMYTPRKFTQAIYKAAMNKNIPTFIVLDEMNLSRIEYYFSDFLSLMENEEDNREIKLVNIELFKKENGEVIPYSMLENGHTLHISPNIWFIGTANRDESTFVISDKVYDRAHTMNFNSRAPKVRDAGTPIEKRFYTYEMIASLFKKALSEGTFDAESNKTIKKVEELMLPFNISFGNRILNQIESFVNIYQACFPKKNVIAEAVETILLSKVVSKLEVKTIDNKEELVQDFEDLGLRRCADFVAKLNED